MRAKSNILFIKKSIYIYIKTLPELHLASQSMLCNTEVLDRTSHEKGEATRPKKLKDMPIINQTREFQSPTSNRDHG
jgi:hypothetical protein